MISRKSGANESSRSGGLLSRAAVAVGLTVFLIGSGSAVGYASWNAQATTNASATAGTAAMTTSGITALTGNYKSGSLVITAPVTVTNTGTVPLAYTFTVSGATNTLASRITLQIWKQSGTCTSTADPIATGTLAAPPVLPANATSAAAGEILVLCLRTTLTGSHSDSLGLTVSPTLAITGTVGTNWSATSSGSFTQAVTYTWYQIVHNDSGKCLSGDSGSSANGTSVIISPCKLLVVGNNQSWRFDPTTGSYVKVVGGWGSNSVWDTSSPGNGAAVELWTPAPDNAQEWRLTAHGLAGTFQFVNRESSRCLHLSSTADGTTAQQRACTTSTTTSDGDYRAQHFSLVEIP